jgi:hypothetical protein
LSRIDELPAPSEAVERAGFEVLRAFIVDGGLTVSLRRAFDDPEAWGILLVDLARHASRIYARETELSEEEALSRIREMLLAELDKPTDLGATRSMAN